MTLVDVPMPAMGTSIVEGTIISWNKAVGDAIALDETICEVSTDKVDTECPSPVAGTVAELLVEVGDTVEVGTAIARVAVEGAVAVALDAAPPPAGLDKAEEAPAEAEAVVVDEPPTPPSNGRGSYTGRVSPVVARIAARYDLDLSSVVGTGRGGRITKSDALAAGEARQAGSNGAEPPARDEPPLHSESPYRPDPPMAAPATGNTPMSVADELGGTSESLSRMRQSIGAAMLRSQAVAATCHTVVECDMSAVEARRRGLGLTALPLIARAVIETLRAFPDLNATLDGTTITRFERVHLGVAVSLGEDGLIVPVIRDAQNLSPEGLGAAIKDLAGRARAKQLSPDEVQGATFTITNPGAFGAVIATPVLDVPQVAILDVEAIVRRPVVIADAAGNESIAIRSMVNLILGWDHRAMDGVYAARFLTALRTALETA